MKSFTRRNFLRTTAVATAALASGMTVGYSAFSYAAEFNLKFANNLPLTHPMNVRAREAAKRIKESTDGRVVLQVFPSSQLGGDTDMLAQARSGAIDFYAGPPVILGTLIPAAQISAVGFAFKNYEQVWAAMDGELGAHIRAEIAMSDGLFAFEKIWDNGFRVTTTSTRPVAAPADLVGMKLRVPPSPIIMSMFRSFDAAPASINFAEVYAALQTHIVEGQENPLTLVNSAKLYEVQKYCSLTNHMWDGFWVLGNKANFSRLPVEFQDTVSKHINEAGVNMRADLQALQATVREDLDKKGLIISDVVPDSFRQKLRDAGYYAQWRKAFGEQAWALLEKSAGALA
ncbi:tripartite ATP-independent transporter solute receptor, DctP family [Pseudomonas asturiensis]|uniref:Tripartite ATP-independent transporter solute receptor, DctP family n=1 Tax=Pseudomonas asturiensis TaxID=1190415 RepID=A0A1M7PUK5_9PSED|nr:TRAP transporter substrate-binding protein [Pseudomonas asturiensis]SHN21146.1 tripartite ATP-independent transporter solute receptor, DctP family [Pseudomonas asturiensis]